MMPPVQCEQCRKELDHDDPAWVAHIVNGQVVPLCVECAVLAGFTREGLE